jgi:2-polyprenyl-3-methyl-5-hydroxy-6-metoxy-1,4-benzoquinol methylase
MSGDSERLRYERVVDEAARDSLSQIIALIAPGSRVLDLGPGVGALGQALRPRRACRVDAIELFPEYIAAAGPHYDRLIVGDFEREALAGLVAGARYDYVVAADVIEHVKDPEALLRQMPDCLAEDGVILLSVPNVGHAGLVAELIGGDWRYRDWGLLDRTHYRFFTRRSLGRSLAAAGLRALRCATVPYDLVGIEFDTAAVDRLPAVARAVLAAMPDADVKQFIVTCVAGAVDDDNAAAMAVTTFPYDRFADGGAG